jgi:eukaryotic-like serine/threonine-protein kinase
MNERVIFEAALEIADPKKRQAFLQKACKGDADLRAGVEALLNSHDTAGSFLDIPAVDQMGHGSSSVTANTIVGGPSDDNDDSDDGRVDLSFLEPSTKAGSIGTLGHYEILEVLGQGGFGVVFKAFDEKLHRVVAIKVMSAQMAAGSPARKRFLREARSAAAIKNENVVQVYSVEEQPLPYLVMEYIDGEPLGHKLDSSGPLETTEVLFIGRQIAAGLTAAHAMGLIHRDIKPGNILLERGVEQKVKIADFGLARAADDASLTRSGMISGTPMYMAPEEALGQALDHRSDLFSLGSILYQMACGRPPFRAPSTLAVLRRVAEDTPRALQEILPQIPDWMVVIINKLLAKKPEDRFQSAKEVADLLARCQSELQLNGKVTCVPSSRSRETSDRTLTSPAASATKTLWLLPAGFIAIAAIITVLIINRGKNNNADLASGARETSGTPSEISNSKSQISNPAPGWHGWPADAPPPAIAPFNAEQARQHQEAWAKYLQIDVEYTNSIGMKFRLIPPGEFTMGSTPEQIEEALKFTGEDTHWQECTKSEAPQHKVILTQPIYLGVNEVTQAEYEKVMGVNPSHFAPSGEGKEAVAGLDTGSHAVETVSWNDAAEFCAKLSKQEELKPFYFRAGETITPLDGTGYRLPTEAEWEYACRAGTTTKFWIGDQDEELVRAGWFGTNFGGRTHAAGELKANPYGLFDIHGNVFEWVEDWWEPTYYGEFQVKPAIDPIAPSSDGSQRVIRGGDWHHGASNCRAANRFAPHPAHRHYGVGFRVSLVAGVSRVSRP